MFRDERGEEVLRVVKKVHKWSGRVEYSGVVEGREVWGVRVHRGMRGVGYSKLIHGYTFTVYVYVYVYVYTSSKKKTNVIRPNDLPHSRRRRCRPRGKQRPGSGNGDALQGERGGEYVDA